MWGEKRVDDALNPSVKNSSEMELITTCQTLNWFMLPAVYKDV